MSSRAFSFRLTRPNFEATPWLGYEALEVEDSVIRVKLREPLTFTLQLGEELVLETTVASSRVVLQSIIDDEVLVLRVKKNS